MNDAELERLADICASGADPDTEGVSYFLIVADAEGSYRMRCSKRLNINTAIGLLTRAANKLDRMKESADAIQ